MSPKHSTVPATEKKFPVSQLKSGCALTSTVTPHCCTHMWMHIHVCRSPILPLLIYHLGVFPHMTTYIGISQKICVLQLPFIPCHSQCWVLEPFYDDFLFCCSFGDRLLVSGFFFSCGSLLLPIIFHGWGVTSIRFSGSASAAWRRDRDVRN